MTTQFPGAIWKPIPGSSTRAKRRKGRAVIFHVAVSEGASLYNTFVASGNDSHLYVRRDGSLEQYVDLDVTAYASVAANASTISVETQGGVTNPDGEPWTEAQVATLARIAKWAHDTEGVPLALMPNSLAASRGIGYHRLGIDPWRVAGGEVWSSSRGKLCPGAAKIAQVPGIIQLALNGDDMSAQAEQQIQALYDAMFKGGTSMPGGLALPQATAYSVWQGTTVARGDGTKVPALQELADAKTQAIAANAALATVVSELASAKGVDPAAISSAVEAGVTKALAEHTVTVDVNVAGTPSAA